MHAVKHRDLNDPPNTYIQGSKCIDFCAGTEGVAEAVKRAGIEAFCQTFYSDHRGLFLDVNMALLLRGTPADLGALQKRGVSGKDPRKILPFQAAVAKYTADHKVVSSSTHSSRS